MSTLGRKESFPVPYVTKSSTVALTWSVMYWEIMSKREPSLVLLLAVGKALP